LRNYCAIELLKEQELSLKSMNIYWVPYKSPRDFGNTVITNPLRVVNKLLPDGPTTTAINASGEEWRTEAPNNFGQSEWQGR
jgi:hypothetical protein